MRCLHCDREVTREHYEHVEFAIQEYENGMQSDVGMRFEKQFLLAGIEHARPDQIARRYEMGAPGLGAVDPCLCMSCLFEIVVAFETLPF